MKQGGYKEIEKYEIGMKQTSQWDTCLNALMRAERRTVEGSVTGSDGSGEEDGGNSEDVTEAQLS